MIMQIIQTILQEREKQKAHGRRYGVRPDTSGASYQPQPIRQPRDGNEPRASTILADQSRESMASANRKSSPVDVGSKRGKVAGGQGGIGAGQTADSVASESPDQQAGDQADSSEKYNKMAGYGQQIMGAYQQQQADLAAHGAKYGGINKGAGQSYQPSPVRSAGGVQPMRSYGGRDDERRRRSASVLADYWRA